MIRAALSFEPLEPRLLCYRVSPFGGFEDGDISISFAPPGTAYNANVAVEVGPMWRACVLGRLEHIETIAQEHGIDLRFHEVSDDGSPHNSLFHPGTRIPLPAQDHTGFGDMRFAEMQGAFKGSTLEIAWYAWVPSDSWTGGGNSIVSLSHPKLSRTVADRELMGEFTMDVVLMQLGVLSSPGRQGRDLTADDIAALRFLYGDADSAPQVEPAHNPNHPTATTPGVPEGPRIDVVPIEGAEPRPSGSGEDEEGSRRDAKAQRGEERQLNRREELHAHRAHVRQMAFALEFAA